jgi:hypothetical protein
MALAGCHRKQPEPSVAGVDPDASAVLADKGAAAIAAVCARQSYATAKVGLIAGETGLREDVFEMRDPVSYSVIPFRLEATVRLEALLLQGAQATGRPKEETQCMQDFAGHLKELSDPLVEAAASEKEVDGLAFQDAEKEAQQEVQQQEQIQKNLR